MSLTSKAIAQLRSGIIVDELLVEFLDTSGTWINIAETFRGSSPVDGIDYVGALDTRPTFSIREDLGGQIYAVDVNSLVLRNDPWKNRAGLFDQPLPVTVNSGTFSSWIGVSVRFRVYTREGGAAVGTQGQPLIFSGFTTEELVTTGDQAIFTLSGPSSRLADTSADQVRNGARWFEAVRLPFLLRRLWVAAGSPTSLSLPDFELPDFAVATTQTLGKCPGLKGSRDGDPYVDQWVPRCLLVDPDDEDVLIVGMECHGSEPLSGGALFRYYMTEGWWEPIIPAFETPFENGEGYPIGLERTSSTYVQAHRLKGTAFNNGYALKQQFYALARARINTSSNSSAGFFSNNYAFWPAAETIFPGGTAQETIPGNQDAALILSFMGHVNRIPQGSNGPDDYHITQGLAVPFAQVIEGMHDLVYSGSGYSSWFGGVPLAGFNFDPDGTDHAFHCGYRLSRLGDDTTGDRSSNPDRGVEAVSDVAPAGVYTVYKDIAIFLNWPGWDQDGSGNAPEYLGFGWTVYLNDVFATPVRFNTTGGDDYWVQLATLANSMDWTIILHSDTSGPVALQEVTLWSYASEGAFDLKQITAWEADSYTGSTTTFGLIVATLEIPYYANTSGFTATVPGPLRTAAKLWRVTVNTSGAVTKTALWTDTYDGTDTGSAYAVVDLFCFRDFRSADGRYSGNWYAAVILDQNAIGSRAYSLAVGYRSGSSWVWEEWIGNPVGFDGPRSSLPFSGFVLVSGDGSSATTNIVYCVDQATGQVWSITATTQGQGATFALLNKGRPIHPTETWLSSKRGAVSDATDGYRRVFWTTAPTPKEDVFGNWRRSEFNVASVRFVPGAYALVQFSTRQEAVIDVADVGDLSVLEAFRMALELVPDYYLVFGAYGTGSAVVSQRPTTADFEMVTRRSELFPALEDSVVPIENDSYRKSVDRKQLYNVVDATPWGLVPQGEPTIEVIRAPGSTFEGDFIYDVRTSRQVEIRLTAVAGGDPILSTETAADQLSAGVLWSWVEVGETASAWTSSYILSESTTVFQIAGIRVTPDERVFAGTTELRVGDQVQVEGGTRVTVTAIGTTFGETVCTLTVDQGVGVTGLGGLLLQIFPNERTTMSDSPDTDLETTSALSGSSSIGDVDLLSVTDVNRISRYMVVQIGREKMIVAGGRRASSGGIHVVRGCFGTAVAAHSTGAKVLLYLRTGEVGRPYPVGDTGVHFGIDIQPETEVDKRTVETGETVIIRAPGSRLAPIRSAHVRSINQASVDIYGKKVKTISKNRFLDIARLEAIADKWTSEYGLPRTWIRNVETRYFRGGQFGTAVTISDPALVPSETLFQIVGVRVDLENMVRMFDLRSLTATAGAAPSTTTTPGFGIGAGMKRPYGGSGRGTLEFTGAFDISFGGGPIAFGQGFARNEFY